MNKPESLEQSLARLATIVSSLEAHDVPLAEAMKLYEEGIDLVGACRKELETAELRITELKRKADGRLAEEDISL